MDFMQFILIMHIAFNSLFPVKFLIGAFHVHFFDMINVIISVIATGTQRYMI